MKNIVMATDLTSSSDRAMERAIKLARENNATLSIIHVIENYKDKKLQNSLNGEAYNLIKKYLVGYKYHEEIDINIQVRSSKDNYSAILNYAHEVKADLIVMGMHGKAKFKDLFIGTTIERVISHSPKPVLMVKNKPIAPYKKIVSGIDYSTVSRSALRFAAKLSPKPDIMIVHSYNVVLGYPTASDYAIEIIEQTESTQRHLIQKFAETENNYLKKNHPSFIDHISYKFDTGSASQLIMSEAKKRKADLIAVGTHGSSMLAINKLGGYAKDILQNPPCDVLVVKE